MGLQTAKEGIENHLTEDSLDFMNTKNRGMEEQMQNDDSFTGDNPTKTPSTAENQSVKGHVSFESHSNNLNTLGANVTSFNQTTGETG